MKKLFLAVSFVLVGSFVHAQETYSINAPSGYVTRLDRKRIEWNTAVCTGFRPPLVATCTQPQACVAGGVAGGASCTVPNARAAGYEIFANTLAGRETFLIQRGLRVLIDKVWKSEDALSSKVIQCINFRAGNATVKNAMCAAAGSPVPAVDCDLCEDLNNN
jgi:hypothetical protein